MRYERLWNRKWKIFEDSFKILCRAEDFGDDILGAEKFRIFSKKDSPLAKILVIYLLVIMAMAELQNRMIVQSRGTGNLEKQKFLRLEAIIGFHFQKNPQIRKRTYGTGTERRDCFKEKFGFFQKIVPACCLFCKYTRCEEKFSDFFKNLCRISKQRTDIPYDEKIQIFSQTGSPL